jgi:plastocyanin
MISSCGRDAVPVPFGPAVFLARVRRAMRRRPVMRFLAGAVVAMPLGLALIAGGAQAQTREIAVSGSEFRFDPKVISVKAGTEVTLVFRNTGAFPHNLAIPTLGIRTPVIPGGRTARVKFTAKKAGTFPIAFLCEVRGHASRGMTGTLRVE